MASTGRNESAVHFKLILFNKDGGQKLETRRIFVDQGVSTSFQYLQEKIKSTFPGIHQGFKVTWTDADGDDVTIRTDEELVISLTEMNGPTYKLNVIKEDSEGRAYQPNHPGEVHQGVTCDGCEGEVRGFRYKCVQCPDYDLCSVCEAKGVIHPGHNMIRIATPQGAWPQHFVRRLGRMQEKINKRSERQENHEKRRNERHCGQTFEPTCGVSPAFQGISQALGPFLDMAGITAGHAQAAMNKAAGDAEKHMKQHEEAVKKAAEIHQKAMMRMVPGCPFTLDVPIVMDTDKEDTKDEEDQKQSDDKKDEKEENVSTSSAEDETPQDFEWTVVGKDDASADQVNATVDANEPAADTARATADAAATLEATASATASVDEEAADLAKEIADAVAKNEEKIIPIQIEGTGEAKETGTKPKDGNGALYPELPQEELQQPKEVPVAKHDDPRVQVALQAMLNMGFKNDGNWLTHLLEAKKGDIGKALDVIQPVQPKRK